MNAYLMMTKTNHNRLLKSLDLNPPRLPGHNLTARAVTGTGSPRIRVINRMSYNHRPGFLTAKLFNSPSLYGYASGLVDASSFRHILYLERRVNKLNFITGRAI